MRLFFQPLLYIIAFIMPMTFAVIGCGDSSETEGATAFAGGGTRANLYADCGVVTGFTERGIDSLTTGFLGTPLPIGPYRFAAVTADHRLLHITYNHVDKSFDFPEGVYPMPELAVDSLGTVYAVTTNGRVVAIDTSGGQAWEATIDEIDAASIHLPTWPVTTGRGVVAGSTAGRLRAFGFDGTQQWERLFGARLVRSLAYRADLGIVVGVTGGDYAVSDTIVVLDEQGTERWRAATNGRIETGPIIAGDRIAVGIAGRAADGKYRPALLLLDMKGEEKGRAPLEVLPLALAADAAGNIYVAGGGGSRGIGGIVASYTAEGRKRWDAGFTRNAPLALLAGDEHLYFVAAQQQSVGVFTYSLEGAYQAYAPIETVASIVIHPFIYSDGVFAVASSDKPLILTGL